MIGSIFPEKLIFEINLIRTKRMNEVVALLLNSDKGSSQNKNGTEKIFSLQSHPVIPLGLELYFKNLYCSKF
jgi:hypothetical protein